jgi:hypothetical protein
MAGTSVLANLAIQISANSVQFNKTLASLSKDLNKFKKDVGGIAQAIGVGFGVTELASFAYEVSKLAGEAQGVKAAFDKIPGSVALMNDLRKATGETVSQLELMKTAVKASNFQINLEQLPKLLEFATLRAQQTGQSVDYLVESIVMGIGRKSPMILDNLGISLIRLREKMKGVGTEAASIEQYTSVVSEIIDEDLGKMALFSENTLTKVQRLSGAWNDVKVAIGEAANESGILGTAIDGLAATMTVLSSKDLSWADKLAAIQPGAFTEMPVALAKVLAMNQRQTDMSKQAVADAKKAFDEIFKKTKDYDSIRLKSADSLNSKNKEFQQLLVEQYNLKSFGRANDEEENALLKLKSIYQKDFNAQIEKMINDLKTAKEASIDPEELKKQLEKAEKEWDKYFKKITAGAEVAYRSVLFAEMMAVGLGKKKEPTPLLALPGFDKDQKKQDENFSKSMLGWIGSPEFRKMINAMDEAQTKARNMQAVFVKMAEAIKDSFKMMAAEGIASFSSTLGQLVTDTESFKDFGKNILRMLAEFMQQFGKQLILIGTGMVAAGSGGVNPLLVKKGLKNIAVGAALSFGSGAIMGAMSSNEQRQSQNQSVAGRRADVSANAFNNNIQITGTLTGSGRELVAVLNNTYYDNKVRKGG